MGAQGRGHGSASQPIQLQQCKRERNGYQREARFGDGVILNGVVKRFENYIPVHNLESVVALTKPEFEELHRLFKFASTVTDAHDPASGLNTPAPHPDQFDKDINGSTPCI